MKCLYISLIAVVLAAGCNRKENKTSTPLTVKKATQRDSVEAVGLKALRALRAKNYAELARLFHPLEGVRFSPYGFIDPTHKHADYLHAA